MKYREFETSSGRRVLAGKSAQSNDELVREFEGKENVIMHTEKRGSPFCVIIDNKKPAKKELHEVAVFCALKSHDWRDNKNDVIVHVFKGKDVYKNKSMPTGTWRLKNFKTIKIKKKEILRLKGRREK